jgi:hypothetical protein
MNAVPPEYEAAALPSPPRCSVNADVIQGVLTRWEIINIGQKGILKEAVV